MSLRCYPALLLALFAAPACAPNDPVREKAPLVKAIILTDTTAGRAERIERLYDDLVARGQRVLISGEAGETAAGLAARLPWLLQPGADAIYYDEDLAGPPGYDSLRSVLDRMYHPASLQRLPASGGE